ncbi:hypothetical protein Hanom_Chr10g00930001 [Helianthus anomalus]
MRIYINRRRCEPYFAMFGCFLMIKIYYNHRYVIMEMSPDSPFYLHYIFVSQLPFLCSLADRCTHQSFCYSLKRIDVFYSTDYPKVIIIHLFDL